MRSEQVSTWSIPASEIQHKLSEFEEFKGTTLDTHPKPVKYIIVLQLIMMLHQQQRGLKKHTAKLVQQLMSHIKMPTKSLCGERKMKFLKVRNIPDMAPEIRRKQ
ncbi:hypothetical protein [Bacillus infantis]|uniref:hypothetical protein n=1 Tax=Bacillus infantis TaxID=324767 RepID=UPI002154FDD1|nr:hypothetical protein [Bacillus infantis]MCR6611344.1 hypothetical protein [Bacillus infantis]